MRTVTRTPLLVLSVALLLFFSQTLPTQSRCSTADEAVTRWAGSKSSGGPASISASSGLDPIARTRLSEAYGKLPLSFEANQGQTDSRVKFLSRGNGYSLFLTPTEAVLSLSKPAPAKGRKDSLAVHRIAKSRPISSTSTAVRMKLVGANPAPQIEGLDELPGKSNYFIGNDPSKWRTNVPNYAKVKYRDVYPGINLVYYGNQQQLEYDLVVAPGADPNKIRLAFEGAQQMRIDTNGDLVLRTAGGEVRQHKPVIYQEVNGIRHAVDGRYVRADKNQISFAVAEYDTSKTLVIDPVLAYSTYLGGNGGDAGTGIAVDSTGNVYVTGTTNSTNFPTTVGTYQAAYGGYSNDLFGDAFVAKLNANGTSLLYSTYLGGRTSDVGNGIAIDSNGNAYVTGTTKSLNFPTTPGAFLPSCTVQSGGSGSCIDYAFVTILNPTGSTLVYSTYLGGGGNTSGLAVAVDSSGNAYVTGKASTSIGSFPTTPGALRCPIPGNSPYVAKFNPAGLQTPAGSALLYCACLAVYTGTSTENTPASIAVDNSGNAYVTGTTTGGIPTTPGAFQTGRSGVNDVFVTKLNANGTALVYSTYLGGRGENFVRGIAVDSSGNAYVTGTTTSTDFPTTLGAFQTQYGGSGDTFVTKLNANGTALVYSTFLGGIRGDGGNGIAIDSAGNAYITDV